MFGKKASKGRVHIWSRTYTETPAGLLPHSCGRNSCSQPLAHCCHGQPTSFPAPRLWTSFFPFSKQLLLFLLGTYFPLLLSCCSCFIFIPFFSLCFLPFLFSPFVTCLPPFPLQENQRKQQHIDTLTKEVFDLQETILWENKHIRV